MEINAVFEGGGVKAIGLVGALKVVEEKGYSIRRVAGTSSGSMVASFIAAGYNADELKTLIMETPFSSFLKKSFLLQINGVGPLMRILIKKGLYSGDSLETWTRAKLAAKGIRTFGDLPPNRLKIIASDITEGRLLVLPDDIGRYGIDPHSFDIARAIRMSTSIPYFFDPVEIRIPKKLQNKKGEPDSPVYIVDGGILSNFPLWVFDGVQTNPERIPTLGFQLVGKIGHKANPIHGPLTMLHALFSTMMEAHDERYIEEHNRYRAIKIPTVGVRTTEFDITEAKSLLLYESGVRAATKFFDQWSVGVYKQQYQKMTGSLKAQPVSMEVKIKTATKG